MSDDAQYTFGDVVAIQERPLGHATSEDDAKGNHPLNRRAKGSNQRGVCQLQSTTQRHQNAIDQIETVSVIDMMKVKDFESFVEKVEAMYAADPLNCRYMIKDGHKADHLVLKVSDNKQVQNGQEVPWMKAGCLVCGV